MKKSLLAVWALASLTLNAQEQDRDRIQDQDRTNLVAVKGEMLQLRERAETHLKEKQTLQDGTVLHPNGTYETPDGKRHKLNNGESLDGNGALYRNEYQYRLRVMQENEGLTQAQVRERQQERVRFTRIEGKLYQIRNEEQHRLQSPMQLGNGMTAYPDASYQLENQQRIQLRDGECLNEAGETFRNMYQMRKRMIQQKQVPGKKMLRKGSPKPNVNAKKKMNS